MYLIGSNRCNCTLKNDLVLVRVGGGYEHFEKYVASNHYQFQLILVTHMKNNNLSLEQVIEKLRRGEKLATNLGTKWNIKKSTLSSNNSTMMDMSLIEGLSFPSASSI
tara:strand:+ start:77 stop:400 length:324 start_codon:yes stop_codon:yes gene_type:complete